MALTLGQLVGNYRILGSLARGGMGEVFLGVHQYIERRAAIKILYPELSRNPEFATRFLNEARAVNLVRHPSLVEIYEFGLLADGTAYLVMEFLDGEPLSRRMARMSRDAHSLPGMLSVARQVALAVAAAHRAGIVHRDLKPDNVMLLAAGSGDTAALPWGLVKVLDFGIAKMTPTPPSSRGGWGASSRAPLLSARTGDGVTLGTPEYMSPEQCTGADTDDRADVYALGVVLYEMLTGRLPFQADLAFDLMAQHVRAPLPRLRDTAPWVPEPLAALATTMMAKDPARRPSMAEVALALAAALRAEEIGAPRALTPAELEATLPPLPAAPSSSSLPTLIPAAPRRARISSEPRASRASRPSGGGRRVLVVDDESALTHAMKLVLELSGYQCHTLGEGEGVLQWVREFKPDLVILDIGLPGKSGYLLCWEIKTTVETAHTAVMLLSGNSREEDQKLGLAMKADAYMIKPFQLPSLLSVIELLLKPAVLPAAAAAPRS